MFYSVRFNVFDENTDVCDMTILMSTMMLMLTSTDVNRCLMSSSNISQLFPLLVLTFSQDKVLLL